MEASQPANSRNTQLRDSPGAAHPRAIGCTAGGRPRLALARQHTPLLPCGLTEEELAALTAEVEERANSGSSRGTSLDAHPPPTLGRQLQPAQQERVSTVPPAPASSTPFAAAAGVVIGQADLPVGQAEAEAEAAEDRRRSFERINRVAAAVAAEMARRRASERRQRQEAPSSSHAMLRALGQALTPRRSASVGQIQDILRGAGTPGVSREAQPALTVAQRLALAGPDDVPAHLPTASHAVPRTAQQPPAPPAAAIRGHSELEGHSGVSRVCLSAPQGSEPGWREQLMIGGARLSSVSHRAQSRLARQSSPGETEVTSGRVPVLAGGALTYAGSTGSAAEAGPGGREVGGALILPDTHALLSVRASQSTPSLEAGTGADLCPNSPITPRSHSRCAGNQQKEAGTGRRKRGLAAAIDRLLRL